MVAKGWKRGTVTLATEKGGVDADGWVKGGVFVHKDGGVWCVTDRPSGYRLYFKNKQHEAMALGEALLAEYPPDGLTDLDARREWLRLVLYWALRR